jgi:hypothetical protein
VDGCEVGGEIGGAPSCGARGRQSPPAALSMMLPRRILVRVETLERRLGRPVPTVLSAEARAVLDAVLRGIDGPRALPEKDRDDRP